MYTVQCHRIYTPTYQHHEKMAATYIVHDVLALYMMYLHIRCEVGAFQSLAWTPGHHVQI